MVASALVEVSQGFERGEKLDIAIYSTDLNVYGKGEWKDRGHGFSQGRTWRKLHIGIGEDSHQIGIVNRQ